MAWAGPGRLDPAVPCPRPGAMPCAMIIFGRGRDAGKSAIPPEDRRLRLKGGPNKLNVPLAGRGI